MMGRFGNQCLQYAFARAYAEQQGLELQTQKWVGENIFEISPSPIRVNCDSLRRLDENSLLMMGHPAGEDFVYCSYSQIQACMIYSKTDLQRWFKFRPEIEEKLRAFWRPHCKPGVVAHRRVGDFIGYGYPVVSRVSYQRQAEKIGLSHCLQYVTEEDPYLCPDIPDEYSFIADFWRLVQAPILLRGNSTFSWLAGALGNGVVYSPRIDGLEGGKEHDVEFELGNHCRFANLPFVTDLHLAT
jgi:hypothetical protein